MPVSATATVPRKTRSGAITRTRVTAAAFAIVDADGADALSARRLAHALDCAAMSLYHHVSSMDAVLDDVVGLLLQKCVPAPLDGRPLRRQLRQAADAYLALALRHPRVFALAAGRRWVSPSAYALAGTLATMFQAGGLSSREAGRAARSLGAYLNGAGMALAGWKLRDTADTAPAAVQPRRQPCGPQAPQAVRSHRGAQGPGFRPRSADRGAARRRPTQRQGRLTCAGFATDLPGQNQTIDTRILNPTVGAVRCG